MFLKGILPPEAWDSLSAFLFQAQNTVSVAGFCKQIIAREINGHLYYFLYSNLPFK